MSSTTGIECGLTTGRVTRPASAGTRARTNADSIGIIETAYTPEPDDSAWLRKVALAARRAFDLGEGVLATFVDTRECAWRDPVVLGCSAAHQRFALEARARLEEHELARIRRSRQALSTVRENLGLRPGQAMPSRMRKLAEECQFVDAALLRVADPTGFGFILGAPVCRAFTPSRRDRARWSRIAAHLAAGYRLQRYASAQAARGLQPRSETLLDPEVNAQHAEAAQREEASRNWLREAARACERARTVLPREGPREALAIWEDLVSGRWSLVDRFSSDGRCHLIARRNDPEAQVSSALTRREQQLVGCALLGHSNKFMAYELGVSQSNVSECIKCACAKLGVGSTAELLQLARSLTAAQHPDPKHAGPKEAQ
ncbi:MAG TPA: LuxR C-terminal-related transcriptional regulator [Polyangiaceae bacterium]|jgi:DNA-binding CsgD family transcriptional regulator|nr:LuxR C-terminal-related transcriptional regulator [Polyangiaceae bacterium]